MKRVLAILIAASALALSQPAPSAPPPTAPPERAKWVQRVYDVKYADANVLQRLLTSVAPGGSNVNAQPDLHAISIGSYDEAFLHTAEELIKRYDVARRPEAELGGRNVELVVYILLAQQKGVAGDVLPPELDGVAKQLRTVFGYGDITLMDSAFVRCREGRESQVTGSFSGIAEGAKSPSNYEIRFASMRVEAGEKRNAIAFKGFHVRVISQYEALPGQWQNQQTGIDTDVSVVEGQKVVIGKSKVGNLDKALVLVLTARVVD